MPARIAAIKRNLMREGTRVSVGWPLLSDKGSHEASAQCLFGNGQRLICENYAIQQISDLLTVGDLHKQLESNSVIEVISLGTGIPKPERWPSCKLRHALGTETVLQKPSRKFFFQHYKLGSLRFHPIDSRDGNKQQGASPLDFEQQGFSLRVLAHDIIELVGCADRGPARAAALAGSTLST